MEAVIRKLHEDEWNERRHEPIWRLTALGPDYLKNFDRICLMLARHVRQDLRYIYSLPVIDVIDMWNMASDMIKQEYKSARAK